jgi:hypothetical protein
LINAQLLRDGGILVASPVDKLQSTDFDRLRLLSDPCLGEPGEPGGLLINAESIFGRDDCSSLLSHLCFARNYHRKIGRIVAVTDNSRIATLPRVADQFAAAHVRHFDYRKRDQAIEWLRGKSAIAGQRNWFARPLVFRDRPSLAGNGMAGRQA